jgi:hypothetical protein
LLSVSFTSSTRGRTMVTATISSCLRHTWKKSVSELRGASTSPCRRVRSLSIGRSSLRRRASGFAARRKLCLRFCRTPISAGSRKRMAKSSSRVRLKDEPTRRHGALGLTQILAWGSSYYLRAVLAEPIVRDTHWLDLGHGRLVAPPAGSGAHFTTRRPDH